MTLLRRSPKTLALVVMLILVFAGGTRVASQQAPATDGSCIASTPSLEHVVRKLRAGASTRGLIGAMERRLASLSAVEGVTECGSGAAPPLPPPFAFVDLGSLGSTTFPNDMNGRGQVVGASRTPEGEFRAFLWENGVMRNLGTLEGGRDSFALKINDQGKVLGFSFFPVPCFPDDPFPPGTICVEQHLWIWNDGVMTSLSQGDVLIEDAIGLNARGQVLAHGLIANESWEPFVWDNGVLTPLAIGAFALAADINDRGQIVGGMYDEVGSRAFLWENGTTTDLGRVDGSVDTFADLINNRGQIAGDFRVCDFSLPLPCYIDLFLQDHGESTVLGIEGVLVGFNDKGQLVGDSVSPSFVLSGFLWDHGVVTDLTLPGGTGSQAFSINEGSQVVGVSRTAGGPAHAFLWDRGVLTDLGVPAGGRSSAAFVVNERGQIAGQWRTLSGQARAFIITPVP